MTHPLRLSHQCGVIAVALGGGTSPVFRIITSERKLEDVGERRTLRFRRGIGMRDVGDAGATHGPPPDAACVPRPRGAAGALGRAACRTCGHRRYVAPRAEIRAAHRT